MEEGRGDVDFLIGTDIIHFSAMDMGCSWKGPEGDYEKKKKKKEKRESWGQFCQHFTSNFCANILSTKNYKAKL